MTAETSFWADYDVRRDAVVETMTELISSKDLGFLNRVTLNFGETKDIREWTFSTILRSDESVSIPSRIKTLLEVADVSRDNCEVSLRLSEQKFWSNGLWLVLKSGEKVLSLNSSLLGFWNTNIDAPLKDALLEGSEWFLDLISSREIKSLPGKPS